MAKRKRTPRRAQQVRQKGTNWLLIGGIIVAGTIGLFALLFLALRQPETQSLAEYCQENPGNCMTKGTADAPVTIVEVSDYACSHCRDFNLQTAGLIEDLYVTPGQVSWIVLPYASRTQTLPAAEASMCAGDQGHFFEYHRRLFELQGQPDILTPAGLSFVAEELGLDQEAFNTCFENNEYADAVQQNLRAVRALSISGTPTFFVNDQKLQGNYPLTAFQQQINTLLGDADAN